MGAVRKIEKAMGNGELVILGEIPMLKKLRSYISN